MKTGILKFAWMLAVVAVGLVLCSGSLKAQNSVCPAGEALYTYSGSTLDEISGDPAVASQFGSVNGYFCLAPAACPTRFSPVPLFTYSFTSGGYTITKQSQQFMGNSTWLSCDALGRVKAWNLLVASVVDYPKSWATVVQIQVAGGSDPAYNIPSYAGAFMSYGGNGACFGGCYSAGSYTYDPGSWSAPNPDCASVLTGSVSRDTNGSEITATFTPNGGSIALAANLCGVHHFSWQQFMTFLSNPNTWLALGPKPEHILTAPPKISDPPPAGLVDPAPHSIVCRGNKWNVAALDKDDGSYPFYYNAAELAKYTTASTLSFYDNPNDACFSGAGPIENPGAHIEFTTTLVGADASGHVINLPVVNTWNWLSTFNGTAGGAYLHKNLSPSDPGTGTGGVEVFSVNGVSTRGTCASDATVDVKVGLGGYAYNMATSRFSQKATLTNTSGATIAGPLSLVLDGLPTGVSLYNETGATNCAAPMGSPFINFDGDLAAGASVAVTLLLPDPMMTPITYKPRVLAGTATR
jgi:hypothetical protein